jgi:hypothetical protein
MFSVYTHLITDSNYLTILFIPATDLDDTKTIFDVQATNLVIVNICSYELEVCAMLSMTKIKIRVLVKGTMI